MSNSKYLALGLVAAIGAYIGFSEQRTSNEELKQRLATQQRQMERQSETTQNRFLTLEQQASELKNKYDLDLESKDAEIAAMKKRNASNEKEVAQLEQIVAQLQYCNLKIIGGLYSSQQEQDSRISLLEKHFPDAETLKKNVLLPSVQVRGNGGVGGGTIVYSKGGLNYVLTAYHVVSKTVKKKDGIETREPVDVDLYNTGSPVTVKADLVAYNEPKDIALLCLRTKESLPCAKLPDRKTLEKIDVFTPVIASGCPLGHSPTPSEGFISSKKKDVKGENFWMQSAPTIFGNSGGGVFSLESQVMVGVNSMICVYDNFMATPVPHLGVMIDMNKAYDWLDSQQLTFIYNPKVTKHECDIARLKARRENSEVVQNVWDPDEAALSQPSTFPNPLKKLEEFVEKALK